MSFLSVNEHPVERVARVGLGVVLIALAAMGTVGVWGCERFGADFSRLLDAMRRQLAEPEPVETAVLERLRAVLHQ